MKVCIDARMVFHSGIGTIIQNFLLNFSGEFELSIIGNLADISPFLEKKKNWKIHHTTVPIYSIREQIELPFLIPKCDIFWSPHYNVPILPIKSKKRVVNINDVFHLAFADTLSLAQRAYSRTVINQAIKRSDKIITISRFSELEIRKRTGYTGSKIEVVYCGVDHHLFRNIDDSEILNRASSKYNLAKPFILFVGNVKPHKNLKNLVLALKMLKDQLADYDILIVGKKDGFITGDPLLFQEISGDDFLNKHVTFTGFVPNEDLPILYNLASLFVFPSYYEGFGLPPLEAMACGCPSIVSNAASIPEICGDATQYFDPHSTTDIADKISEALSPLKRKDFHKKGIERANSFSWLAYYNQQIHLFKELLK